MQAQIASLASGGEKANPEVLSFHPELLRLKHLQSAHSCRLFSEQLDRTESDFLEFAERYESENDLFAYGEVDPLEMNIQVKKLVKDVGGELRWMGCHGLMGAYFSMEALHSQILAAEK